MNDQDREDLKSLAPINETVGYAKRTCKCGNIIPKNEPHFAQTIHVGRQGYPKRINYCLACAVAELKQFQRGIAFALEDAEKLLKEHPEVTNRKTLQKIKNGTALQPEEEGI